LPNPPDAVAAPAVKVPPTAVPATIAEIATITEPSILIANAFPDLTSADGTPAAADTGPRYTLDAPHHPRVYLTARKPADSFAGTSCPS
jgi:hypothetical protein